MQDYKVDEDPAIFKSVKTGRGPLGPNWMVGILFSPFILNPYYFFHQWN